MNLNFRPNNVPTKPRLYYLTSDAIYPFYNIFLKQYIVAICETHVPLHARSYARTLGSMHSERNKTIQIQISIFRKLKRRLRQSQET